MVQVLSFGFAPMKGTLHSPQQDAALTPRGTVGDRSLCLVDVAGQKVLRTVANPRLLALKVAWRQRMLCLEIPGQKPYQDRAVNGEALVCDYWGRNVKLHLLETGANQLLSSYLGKPVKLARAETGDIIFGAPYSLLGSESLAYLARRLRRPELLTEHARFRSTFLVKTQEPFEEDNWAGRTIELEVSGQVPASLTGTRLTIGEGIGRCAVINFNPTTGEKDLSLLKELSTFRPKNQRGEPTLGVFAELF